MASFDLPQTLKTAACLFVLGAAAAPHSVHPQSAFEPVAETERQREIVDEIQQLQSQDGTFSADLIDPWTALSLLYEEGGNRNLAAAAIAQARQVVRVNYGLFSMEEAPLIRQAVRNERARGDVEAAWNLEQQLVRLAMRHRDDLRTVPILTQIADERLDVLARYRAGGFPEEIVLGCYYQGGRPPTPSPWQTTLGGNCRSGERSQVVTSLSLEARSYYSDAILVMARNGLYASDKLRDMEARLITMSYSFSDYPTGKQSYRRLMSYNAANSAPWLDRITTFVEMTDWDLLFKRTSGTQALDRVLDAYEQAYALLQKEGVEQTSIDRIFSPKVPVVVPAFRPNPLASAGSSESTGYFDVAFEITKYGAAAHVEVLDATTNATNAEKRDLVQLIKRSVFRPRVTDGRLGQSSTVELRYYLDSPR